MVLILIVIGTWLKKGIGCDSQRKGTKRKKTRTTWMMIYKMNLLITLIPGFYQLK